MTSHGFRDRRRQLTRCAVLVGNLAALAACSDSQPSTRARVGPVSGGRTTVIRMTDAMRYAPDTPTVFVGDTIIWFNAGAMPHMTSDEPGRAGVPEHNVLPEGAASWHSGLLEPGATFTHSPDVPGEYTYVCPVHEALGMVGRITVKARPEAG